MHSLEDEQQAEISQFRRWVISGLSSIVFLMASAWAGWTTNTLIEMRDMLADRPTHAEVKNSIDSHAPYVRDEQLIKQQLKDINIQLDKLDTKVDNLRDQVMKLND